MERRMSAQRRQAIVHVDADCSLGPAALSPRRAFAWNSLRAFARRLRETLPADGNDSPRRPFKPIRGAR